jgi:superfamily I DNA/RNA helicase
LNPFQRARDEAIAVRLKLLGVSANNLIPAKDLLGRVENVLNIAIESVPATYPDLGGGTAVLQREQEFIYVNDEIEKWGDHFCGLVAHELGHYYLDPTKATLTVAHLKSLLTSPGSPGVMKVEAYGARERLELQANVFARELLLPRDVARTIAQAGQGPRAIADATGIPLEFVRQQMLDALLLPEGSQPPHLPHVPSPDQFAAASCAEQAANVVAGPGTGKTTTLILRVKHLIEQRGVHPSRILVVTFTNKAAFELVERLRNSGTTSAAEVWAGTFHAFGLEFLRKYHQRFGLEADLHVSDQLATVSMLVAGLPRIRLNHFLRVEDPYIWLVPVVEAIKRLKEELVTPASYRTFVMRSPHADSELQQKRLDVAAIYELHETLLAERKTVDFVDLVMKPALALKADRSQYEEFIGGFEHVLVDEYQDVTQAMVALLREVAHKKSIWVVGDVRQAIHHWRGASLKSLLKFESVFKAHASGAKIRRYALTNNRRSFQEVVDLTQLVGRDHVLEASLALDTVNATKGNCGAKPTLVTCSTKDGVLGAMLQNIRALHGAGVAFGQQAVLCRSTSDVQRAAERLAVAGIPAIYVGDLAQRPEIKRILCLMQLLVERRPKTLVGLLETPGIAMPLPDIERLLAATETDLVYQRGRWIQQVPPGLSSEALGAIVNIRALIGSYRRGSNPWDLVCDLILEKRFGLPSSSDNSVNAWVQRIALWQFAYAVRNGDGDAREATLSRYLLRQRLRIRVGDSQVQRELPPEMAYLDGVRLTTVHSSKGLEFEAVHLGYVTAGHYGPDKPSWEPDNIRDILPPEALGSSIAEYQSEEAVERNNLLYVAVSRAKRHLFIYQDTEYGRGNLAPQFIGSSGLFSRVDFRGAGLMSKVSVKPSSFVKPASLSFSDFHAYADCPLNYWYSRVAGLQGESETDVSIRARRAILAALKEIAKDAVEADITALKVIWTARQMPSEVTDPHLWEDVEYAFNNGLQWIQAAKLEGGSFWEPVSQIGAVAVEMPWGFTFRKGQGQEFRLIRFSRRSSKELVAILRPLVNGLKDKRETSMTLQYLLSNKSDPVPPSLRIESTTSYGAASRLTAGEIGPRPGRQCGRCDFTTICPISP